MSMDGSKNLLEKFSGVLSVEDGRVEVKDEAALVAGEMEKLLGEAVFAEEKEERLAARWLIRMTGQALGIVPASIQSLYEARGRDEYKDFSVPAINLRGLTFEIARAIFRSAARIDLGAVLFEIAKSEIGYTFQRPSEYAAHIMAAAVVEGYRGPLFIQGDHFQANAKDYAADSGKVVGDLKDLIGEALEAGFYNIDIDTSTLVDLSRPTVKEQQELNYRLCAELTEFIREREPEGVVVSVGGEIGEVGTKNSTAEELVAFMDGYRETLKPGLLGISKISIQTGTSHGGVPLPDGTVAEVALDFGCLEELGRVGREKYGLAGAVHHGASTLPDEAFYRFPETQTAEIHLATAFQNMTYDSKHLPAELREKVYAWLRENCAGDRKAGMTEEQFIYKTRKKGFGPFKREFMELPRDVKDAIMAELENKFNFIFKKLGGAGTRELVLSKVKAAAVNPPPPPGLDVR